jgi:hypothetical protein
MSGKRSFAVLQGHSLHEKVCVVGFHFVCDKGKGVTTNLDGTIWAGTWVVAQVHAERAEKIGLTWHCIRRRRSRLTFRASSKAGVGQVVGRRHNQNSAYLQGIIKGWRRTSRGKEAQSEFGIDFLLEPTSEPHQWKGDGAGEKGYLWSAPTT